MLRYQFTQLPQLYAKWLLSWWVIFWINTVHRCWILLWGCRCHTETHTFTHQTFHHWRNSKSFTVEPTWLFLKHTNPILHHFICQIVKTVNYAFNLSCYSCKIPFMMSSVKGTRQSLNSNKLRNIWLVLLNCKKCFAKLFQTRQLFKCPARYLHLILIITTTVLTN